MAVITVFDSIHHSGGCGCGGGGARAARRVFEFEARAIRAAGGEVEVFTFEADPMAFTAPPINEFVASKGFAWLPAIAVDDVITMAGRYPTRDEMATWAELTEEQKATLLEIPEETLPLAGGHGGSAHRHGHGGGGCACGGRGHQHAAEAAESTGTAESADNNSPRPAGGGCGGGGGCGCQH